jgi:hypothetical protein
MSTNMPKHEETSLLTIAQIRKGPKGEDLYLFNERQRIYSLSEQAAATAPAMRSLAADAKENEPLQVTLDLERGTVLNLAPPPATARTAFVSERSLLGTPDKVVPIEVSKIDPTSFDVVDLQLKWKAFTLCTKIVPSYAKAKEIFDFFASLSCHLPGPPAVPPCIPFQYVRDGCYARAHQMRRLITDRYGVCCEKVFSFANKNNDELAVRADKWGGCCVTWWYHVAPLLRVRVTINTTPKVTLVLAMVIDPGMFNKPVLLSTWLAAQENKVCSSRAHVSMYSIQPGTAYAPANYAATAFSTDPTYAATESTLIAYKNLITCT